MKRCRRRGLYRLHWVSPAFIGGCGLKRGIHRHWRRLQAGFARLYWRVRIETFIQSRYPSPEYVSPAFIGGCGLKPPTPKVFDPTKFVSPAFIGGCGLKQVYEHPAKAVATCFARLYWRVRIETMPDCIAPPHRWVSPAFIGGCGLKHLNGAKTHGAYAFRPPLLAGAD